MIKSDTSGIHLWNFPKIMCQANMSEISGSHGRNYKD